METKKINVEFEAVSYRTGQIEFKIIEIEVPKNLNGAQADEYVSEYIVNRDFMHDHDFQSIANWSLTSRKEEIIDFFNSVNLGSEELKINLIAAYTKMHYAISDLSSNKQLDITVAALGLSLDASLHLVKTLNAKMSSYNRMSLDELKENRSSDISEEVLKVYGYSDEDVVKLLK